MQGAADYGNLRHRIPSAALSASGSLGMISTGPTAQYPRLLFHTYLIAFLPSGDQFISSLQGAPRKAVSNTCLSGKSYRSQD